MVSGKLRKISIENFKATFASPFTVVVVAAVSWMEVQRLFHLSVFESLQLANGDLDKVLDQETAELSKSSTVIPWDDPLSFARDQLRRRNSEGFPSCCFIIKMTNLKHKKNNQLWCLPYYSSDLSHQQLWLHPGTCCVLNTLKEMYCPLSTLTRPLFSLRTLYKRAVDWIYQKFSVSAKDLCLTGTTRSITTPTSSYRFKPHPHI